MELLTKEKGFIADRKIAASVKAKMFAGNNFEQIEKAVNDWLNRQNIIVQHIGQSQCERNGNLLLLITIFYNSVQDN